MKKLLLFTALLFVLTSCSKDDSDTETNTEDFTKYHATWNITSKTNSNGNNVSFSSCKNSDKITISSDGTASLYEGTVQLSGCFSNNIYIPITTCRYVTLNYTYEISNSKLILTTNDNVYKITYEIISVSGTTLVIKRISTSTNGTVSTFESPTTFTYTKAITETIIETK